MVVGDLNSCIDFPCLDVRHAGHKPPAMPARCELVRVMMIAAAPPADRTTAMGASTDPLIRQGTIDAFQAAGYDVTNVNDVRLLGVYATTAVKCPKLGFGLKPETIANCCHILESEIDMFPNLRSILLMGNTAIKAVNEIAVRRYGAPAIPTGSAYKVKSHEYRLGEISLFPSYPESGENLSVEGSRQEIVAVDIRNAVELAGGPVNRSHQSRPKREPHHSLGPQPNEARERSAE